MNIRPFLPAVLAATAFVLVVPSAEAGRSRYGSCAPRGVVVAPPVYHRPAVHYPSSRYSSRGLCGTRTYTSVGATSYIQVTEPVYRSSCRPVYRPVCRPVYRPVCRPVYRPTCRPVYRSCGPRYGSSFGVSFRFGR